MGLLYLYLYILHAFLCNCMKINVHFFKISLEIEIETGKLANKNANHSSLIRNNVVPCICLRVMTHAWSDVTRNAGIRKTNRATRYVGPRVAGCALCYRVVTYYLYAQESFNLGE